MGIDIRAYVCHEWGAAAPYGTLKMSQVAGFSILRDRQLFEVLAGAGLERSGQLFPPRGLPDGAPLFVAAEAEAMGMNKPSWLTTSEVEEALAAYPQGTHARRHGVTESRQAAVPALLASMRAVDEWCAEHDPGGRAVLVFFFDS